MNAAAAERPEMPTRVGVRPRGYDSRPPMHSRRDEALSHAGRASGHLPRATWRASLGEFPCGLHRCRAPPVTASTAGGQEAPVERLAGRRPAGRVFVKRPGELTAHAQQRVRRQGSYTGGRT
jgi:hypothetical protein